MEYRIILQGRFFITMNIRMINNVLTRYNDSFHFSFSWREADELICYVFMKKKKTMTTGALTPPTAIWPQSRV